ncbi:hypothetical protein F383_39114 [Gossypium arboreum]|uniref:Uncharacterized protein n=1 Tax=Gossypium arboreum TaxID=29729 RepID=A0A0B0MJH6_GOSAR|nr:hypothetical protein F383_39114 [Gossypium arboreum]
MGRPEFEDLRCLKIYTN